MPNLERNHTTVTHATDAILILSILVMNGVMYPMHARFYFSFLDEITIINRFLIGN